MTKLEHLDFKIALGAVKHFGRNLYTSNPPAITELIANAWDAYATVVHIYINGHGDNQGFILSDNGIGMNDEELIFRYATSGVEKDSNVRVPNQYDTSRKYMGKKGIGKFASFSLGEEYHLYTRSHENEDWRRIIMKYSDLNVDEPIVKVDVEYFSTIPAEVAAQFDAKFTQKRGTIIHIPKLKRKITNATLNSLPKLLSRRFSPTILAQHKFIVKINNESIDLEKHFYDEAMEFVYYTGISLDKIKSRFSGIFNPNFFQEIDNAFFEEHNIVGWIGAVKKTDALKVDEDITIKGIVVYINGKLADENILKTSPSAAVPDSYIVGEFDADFLQNDIVDPVLSSREGLNYELDDVQNLRDQLIKLRAKLISNWNDLRSARARTEKKYLDTALQSQSHKKIYESWDSTKQKEFDYYAQRLFDNDEPKISETIDVYTSAIISLVNTRTLGKLSTVSDNENNENIVNIFQEIFNLAEINEALALKKRLQDRLLVIKKLENCIEQEEIEKVFEEHIASNIWLIEPFWDNKKVAVHSQERYKEYVEKNRTNKSGIIDILIDSSEEKYPVIIELKRSKKTSYSFPTALEIFTQITNYRTHIINKDFKDQHVNTYDIKAYFICSNDLKSNNFNDNDFNLFDTNKIKILTYEMIIDNAKRMYKEALELDITTRN